MNLRHSLPSLLLWVAAGLAVAGPGHDHGDDKPVVAANIAPRFTAHTELFELTGVLGDKRITLYLDEYASNRPIGKATIALDIKGADDKLHKLAPKPGDDAVFVITLDAPLAAGTYAVTAAVTAVVGGKEESDLLVATLEVGPAPGAGGSEEHAHGMGDMTLWIAGGAAGSILILAAVWLLRGKRAFRRGSPA